ncbi:MarR family transcriptional regulator [Hymenobacter sp. UV11]|uniref:MarR family winged helix-turn-helix transcriptional regulator n=1 Tax=Hymenobacter sp. UV11 TaxID=1849735 RepID=UPI0010601AF8|nr:MarR family transcriptional regulator [Hymenobacter sp. UV11]TDN40605.1 MarR family transcriptional regulator [Hymenobacter sp. UV11]TFZ66376.1 MarR family transcriptional regulator [Hymenobacter sp. UV11]
MANSPTPPAPDDLLKLGNQLCFPFYAVSRQLTKAYQPYLQALGLTYPQYLVLLLLWEHERLTVKELGERLLLDSGTLTPLLKRMEQQQWLSRRRDPRDERSVVISLLPGGRALEAQACHIPAQMLAKVGLTLTELDALRTQLTHILTRLT